MREQGEIVTEGREKRWFILKEKKTEGGGTVTELS